MPYSLFLFKGRKGVGTEGGPHKVQFFVLSLFFVL